MGSPKPFASHGKPPSNKYVFGKTNLPGGLKELPESRTANSSVETKNQTDAERVAAGKAEVNQLEMKEAERRKNAIVQAQLNLMTQIISSTEQQLREEMMIELTPLVKADLRSQFSSQMKQEVYSKVGAEISAYKDELRPQLIKAMTPTIEATVRQECQQQMKDEVYAGWNKVADELQNEVKGWLYKDLEPSVKASLRDALNDSVREDLENELRPVIYQESEARMKAHEVELRQRLKKDLEKEIRAELKNDLRHSVKRELRQEIKDAWVREDERLLQRSCHDDRQFSEKRSLDQQTTSDHQLYSAYQHKTYREDEIPQIQTKSFYSSIQDQTCDTPKAHVKQHTECLYKENLSQLQYDDGPGSSGEASPEIYAQNYRSSVGQFVGKQSDPIGGTGKKRRRSLDDQDHDFYNDNRRHDKKRRRSYTHHPQYVELNQYLPGEVLGMPQPKATASTPFHSIKPPIDTLEREVEDVYGPAPMRPKNYAYSFGTSLTDHFLGQEEEEEGGEDDYASLEKGARNGKENTDPPRDTTEQEFEDEGVEEYFHDQPLRYRLDIGISPSADIRNTSSQGNSINDPITLESSDDEDYSTGEETWDDQDRTLVGNLGEVQGKGYLVKEVYEEVEDEGEEDEEEL